MLGCLPLFLILMLLAPVFLVLSYFNAITLSFHRLGLSTQGATLLFRIRFLQGSKQVGKSSVKVHVR